MEGITIIIALTLLIISLIKSRSKTREAIKFARGMFLKTGSDLLGILLIISGILTLLPEELIKTALGGSNIYVSSLLGTIIGSVTIIPAFIAFPISKSLIEGGAHLVSVAGFLTTLTMVGVATYPIEVKHFGKKFTLFRNLLSFAGALIIALVLGVLVK